MNSPAICEGLAVSVDADPILDRVAKYYSGKVTQHGATPAGVDWNGEASQRTRFVQLCRLLEPSDSFSLLDYGCGYGALYDYLIAQDCQVDYTGVDISEAMLAQARARHPEANWLSSTAQLTPRSADYVVASGIFSVKLEFDESRWHQYILDTMGEMDRLSRSGFAFNCLTAYSDQERKRPDLYYPRPEELFAHCKEQFSRNVALLHDYDLYEFTILVRKA